MFYNKGVDKKIREKVDAYFTKFKRQLYKKGEILVRADDDPRFSDINHCIIITRSVFSIH